MPHENSQLLLTDKIRRLLQEVKNYKLPPKEDTLLSISEHGHFDNSIVDILAYFMQPKGQHGFESCFLRTFFECMKVDWRTLGFEWISVMTQVQTADGKWIDLLVTGRDWVLVIVNRLRTGLDNPLSSYEEYARRLTTRRIFFAILSPRGDTARDWITVTYPEYCEALKSATPRHLPSDPAFKWDVLAREFIIHLENESKQPAALMTANNFAAVESHLREIGEIKRLYEAYIEYILRELNGAIRLAVPTHSFVFSDADWALVTPEPAGRLAVQLVFQTPIHEVGNKPKAFRIAAYVNDLTAGELDRINSGLSAISYPADKQWHCWEESFSNSSDAVEGLCALSRRLIALLPVALEAAG
jgi:hypothetical protein